MTNDEDGGGENQPRPLQFGLKSLLAITAATALLFGLLRWFEAPPRTSALILLIVGVSVAAAVALVAAIAGVRGDDGEG